MLRQAGAAVAAAVLLAGCSSAGGNEALPGGDRPAPAATTGPSATGPTTPAAGTTQLARGAVRLTVRPQDAAQRPVLDSYLGFFAAYAEALGTGDARSAALRRHSTAAAFADFSRGVAENARAGITVRGPVALRPALRGARSGALTVVLVDCLDATGQRSYDRAGKPTGGPGVRRPIQVELVNSPGPVRWVVGSVADGPATACERSGS